MEGRNLIEIAEEIKNSGFTVALTGAGISTESGIPDFRSKNGIWSRFNIDEYGHIDNLEEEPEKVWKMLKVLIRDMKKAKPNRAHIALAEMEKMGYLHAIITQNVDGLHQAAGSKNVIEFHGNFREAICLKCGKIYPIEYALNQNLPKCECGGLLKPNATFFGEPIPKEALIKSFEIAKKCDTMLVIGTSASVYPAAELPLMAKENDATVIEINMEGKMLPYSDYSIKGMAGDILSEIAEILK